MWVLLGTSAAAAGAATEKKWPRCCCTCTRCYKIITEATAAEEEVGSWCLNDRGWSSVRCIWTHRTYLLLRWFYYWWCCCAAVVSLLRHYERILTIRWALLLLLCAAADARAYVVVPGSGRRLVNRTYCCLLYVQLVLRNAATRLPLTRPAYTLW